MAKISKLTLALSLLLITQLPALSQSWQEDDASARALMKQGKYDEAQDALLHALANSPPEQRGSVLLHLSIVQRKSGNMEGARKTLTIAKEHASKLHDTDLSANVDKEIIKTTALVTSTPVNAPLEIVDTQPTTTSNQSKTLCAGVQMQASLPALNPLLTPGNRFDKTTATNLLRERVESSKNQQIEEWRRVPQWLAGGWSSKRATTIYSRSFRTNTESRNWDTYVSISNYFIGDCSDAAGQAWERRLAGWMAETQSETTITQSFTTKRGLHESDAKHELTSSEGIAFVRGFNGSILDSYQYATITLYEFAGGDYVRQEQWKRVYDANGRPTSEAVNVSLHRKVHPFMDFGDFEQHQSLSAYLRSRNLGYLSPLPIETTSSARR